MSVPRSRLCAWFGQTRMSVPTIRLCAWFGTECLSHDQVVRMVRTDKGLSTSGCAHGSDRQNVCPIKVVRGSDRQECLSHDQVVRGSDEQESVPRSGRARFGRQNVCPRSGRAHGSDRQNVCPDQVVRTVRTDKMSVPRSGCARGSDRCFVPRSGCAHGSDKNVYPDQVLRMVGRQECLSTIRLCAVRTDRMSSHDQVVPGLQYTILICKFSYPND